MSGYDVGTIQHRHEFSGILMVLQNLPSDLNFWDLEGMLHQENICNLFQKKPVVVNLLSTVAEVIQVMKENNSDYVLVRDGEDKPVGIFTAKDIINKVLIRRNPSVYSFPIANFMTPSLKSLTCQDTIKIATNDFYLNRFNHLPIIDDVTRKICGMVGLDDLLFYISDLFPETSFNFVPETHSSGKNREGA